MNPIVNLSGSQNWRRGSEKISSISFFFSIISWMRQEKEHKADIKTKKQRDNVDLERSADFEKFD